MRFVYFVRGAGLADWSLHLLLLVGVAARSRGVLGHGIIRILVLLVPTFTHRRQLNINIFDVILPIAIIVIILLLLLDGFLIVVIVVIVISKRVSVTRVFRITLGHCFDMRHSRILNNAALRGVPEHLRLLSTILGRV